MPSFKCKDIGMKDNFEVKSDSQDELMQTIAVHAKITHGWDPVPPDVLQKVQKAIKK